MNKKTAAGIIAAGILASVFAVGCGEDKTAVSQSSVSASDGQSSVNITATVSQSNVDRKKVVLRDEVVDEFVKLFDGKSFRSGDTVDVSAIKVSGDEAASLERLINTVKLNTHSDYDKTAKIFTFGGNYEVTLTYDKDTITVKAIGRS